MDSTLVDQCRKDHTESRRGHIDLQKSPSSSYRSDKVKQCTGTLTHLGAGCHYIGYNEPGVMGPLIIISDAVSPSPHQSRSQSEAAGTH